MILKKSADNKKHAKFLSRQRAKQIVYHKIMNVLLSNSFKIIEQQHEISNNVVCATSKASDQPGHTCSLIRAFASRLYIL